MRSPLGRALGLGSAKGGTDHWWAQRVTAVALIPLIGWAVVSLLMLGRLDHDALVQWIDRPINTIALLLLLGTLFYHSELGIQVVIEDYVHVGWLKVPSLMLSKFVHVALGVASIFAVLKIAFGI